MVYTPVPLVESVHPEGKKQPKILFTSPSDGTNPAYRPYGVNTVGASTLLCTWYGTL
jgi:hypothetical protein